MLTREEERGETLQTQPT